MTYPFEDGRILRVRNGSNGRSLGDRIARAESLRDRTVGLLGRSSLANGEGLWIEPCSSIHMFFMRFAIDAVFVDRHGKVTRTFENLRPWQIALGGRGARAVLELPVGTVAGSSTRVGDALVTERAE